MTVRHKRSIIVRVMMIAVCCIVVVPAVQAQQDINEHFEFVRDREQITWTDLTGETLERNSLEQNLVGVSDGVKVGGVRGTPTFDRTGDRVYFPDSVQVPSVEVSAETTRGGADRGARGIWEARLPLARHVQVEAVCDVFNDELDVAYPAMIALIVEEEKDTESGVWSEVKRFDLRTLPSRVQYAINGPYESNGERFHTHSLIADLSDWAGQYVRLTFEVRFLPAKNANMRVRWLRGRLVSATFKYAFVGDAVTIIRGKVLGTRENGLGLEVDMNITGLSSFPDLGICCEKLDEDDRYIVYNNASVGSVSKSVPVFHIESGEDLYTCTKSELQNALVKENGGSPKPGGEGGTGNAHTALRQTSGNAGSDDYQLDNYYTGVGGVIQAYLNGSQPPILHTVFHAEDKYYGGSTDINYIRIGYARTDFIDDASDAYHLTRLAHSDAAAAPTPTPSPPTGGWGNAIITSKWTEAQAAAEYDPENPTHNHWGAGQPCLIGSGNYYYIFYYHLGEPGSEGNDQGVCLARAAKSSIDVSQSSYESGDNPWMKYDGSGYNEDGIGGEDTPLDNLGYGDIDDNEARHNPRVSYNLLLDKWIMMAEWGANYLHTSNNLATGWDTGMQVSADELDYAGLIGEDDDTGANGPASDKITTEYNQLYYQDLTGDTNMYRRSLRIYD